MAAAYGLPEIAQLSGDFLLSHEAGGVIAAELRLSARLTQICVVTLEPFDALLAEQASLRFVPSAVIGEAAELGAVDDAALEAPDELPYSGGATISGAARARFGRAPKATSRLSSVVSCRRNCSRLLLKTDN